MSNVPQKSQGINGFVIAFMVGAGLMLLGCLYLFSTLMNFSSGGFSSLMDSETKRQLNMMMIISGLLGVFYLFALVAGGNSFKRTMWSRSALLVVTPVHLLLMLLVIMGAAGAMHGGRANVSEGNLAFAILFAIANVGISIWGLVVLAPAKARNEFYYFSNLPAQGAPGVELDPSLSNPQTNAPETKDVPGPDEKLF